jgi:hypothetical protein
VEVVAGFIEPGVGMAEVSLTKIADVVAPILWGAEEAVVDTRLEHKGIDSSSACFILPFQTSI